MSGPLPMVRRPAVGNPAGWLWRATVARVVPTVLLAVPGFIGVGLIGNVEVAPGLTLTVGDDVWVGAIEGVRNNLVVLGRRGFVPPAIRSGVVRGAVQWDTSRGRVVGSKNTAGQVAYTPAWTGATTNPTLPASVTGWYSIRNGWCTVQVVIMFDSFTTGGSGQLFVSLPVPGVGAQFIQNRLTIPGVGAGNYIGFAAINDATALARPYFAVSTASHPQVFWRNTDSTGAAGLGQPLVSGGFPIQAGGSFLMSGTYRVAA